jgi:hypothetical protein
VPHAQDVHRIARHFINQDVRPGGHELADCGIAAAPTTPWEHHQAVTGEQQRAGDFARRDWVFVGDIADQPNHIGAGRSPPDHSHNRRRSGARALKSPAAILSSHSRMSA